ncbi:MAG: DUF1631 family protein [Burkholderiales bacterium]|nr:DUF1631 family protein [Burkholderiales bacterium]
MTPHPVHRLPPALENAVQRVKLAARAAVERTIESLGLASLASKDVFHRDSLLGAQYELNRKSAVFALAFNEAFDQRVLREVAPSSAEGAGTNWDSMSLVSDHEVEIQVLADRFGLEVAHECEWELRELDAYMASVLAPLRHEQERDPLRPEVVGHALIRAVEAVSDRPELRKVLIAELGRSFGTLLRTSYGEIVADLRQSGVQPAGLSVRGTESRSVAGALDGAASAASDFDSRYNTGRRSGFGPSAHGGGPSQPATAGAVDPRLMTLIRRIAFNEPASTAGWRESGDGGLANLIHVHRDELRQAASGSLDHRVIDVIGALFDQILADPKVPPQMARLIARLQLPVLRTALGDPSFFSSRRHPVRRFVNRVASLGAAFDDFDGEAARRVLAKVRELVEEVVEGDFEQIALYEHKLSALEDFVAELGRNEAQEQGGAAELLGAKEDELRLRLLYAEQLKGVLGGLTAPEFVRDFVSRVWSQVLLKAAETGGPDGEPLRRLRGVGRELFMSVQPKTSPAQRKTFLAELPKLMKELGQGMDLIGWPEASRRAFFGQLLPAHAESLRAQPQRALDFNLLSRQVDGALQAPLPSRTDLAARALPVLSDAVDAPLPAFTAEEAKRVGLVDESAVDWNGKVDIDLGEEAAPEAAETAIEGLPAPTGPVEPSAGRQLADHVQIGCAYQLHIDDSWQKVRLVHVSAGRSFFVFNRGKRHKQAISLTQRMLVRLCETGRLRAYEQAYLLERATARARRQLASIDSSA